MRLHLFYAIFSIHLLPYREVYTKKTSSVALCEKGTHTNHPLKYAI